MTARPAWLWTAGVVAVAACAAWALWPLGSAAPPAMALREAAPSAKPRTLAKLDRDAFGAPLWAAPPAAPAPPPAAAPPPPLRLQLIAILREDGVLKASLYDPDTDAMLLVGPGDAIAGRTVERVGPATVDVRDNGLTRTLSLKAEGP